MAGMSGDVGKDVRDCMLHVVVVGVWGKVSTGCRDWGRGRRSQGVKGCVDGLSVWHK